MNAATDYERTFLSCWEAIIRKQNKCQGAAAASETKIFKSAMCLPEARSASKKCELFFSSFSFTAFLVYPVFQKWYEKMIMIVTICKMMKEPNNAASNECDSTPAVYRKLRTLASAAEVSGRLHNAERKWWETKLKRRFVRDCRISNWNTSSYGNSPGVVMEDPMPPNWPYSESSTE